AHAGSLRLEVIGPTPPRAWTPTLVGVRGLGGAAAAHRRIAASFLARVQSTRRSCVLALLGSQPPWTSRRCGADHLREDPRRGMWSAAVLEDLDRRVQVGRALGEALRHPQRITRLEQHMKPPRLHLRSRVGALVEDIRRSHARHGRSALGRTKKSLVSSAAYVRDPAWPVARGADHPRALVELLGPHARNRARRPRTRSQGLVLPRRGRARRADPGPAGPLGERGGGLAL